MILANSPMMAATALTPNVRCEDRLRLLALRLNLTPHAGPRQGRYDVLITDMTPHESRATFHTSSNAWHQRENVE